MHPTNRDTVFIGGNYVGTDRSTAAVYRSLDGGGTWALITMNSSPRPHPDINAFGFSKDGTTLYVASDGGLDSTTEWGKSNIASSPVVWKDLNAMLPTAQLFHGHGIDPTDINVSYAGAQDTGVQKKSSAALAWDLLREGGDCGWLSVRPDDPRLVYASCKDEDADEIDIRRLAVSGTKWDHLSNGLNGADPHESFPPVVIDPSNPRTLYVGTDRIYQTNDGGDLWGAVSPSFGVTVTSIAVAPSDASVVYAGTSDGHVKVRSGTVWNDVSIGLPQQPVTQIAIDPRSPSTAWAVFAGFGTSHVFRTTNGGASWVDRSSGLPAIPVNDLVADPDLPNVLYLAAAIGVYRSMNGGDTWSPLGAGLPAGVIVSGLKLDRRTRTLRAATFGRGMWDLQVPKGRAHAVRK